MRRRRVCFYAPSARFTLSAPSLLLLQALVVMGDLLADQDKGPGAFGSEASSGATARQGPRSVDSAPAPPPQRSRLVLWALSGIFVAWLAYACMGRSSSPSAEQESSGPVGNVGSSKGAAGKSMWPLSLGRDREAQDIRKVRRDSGSYAAKRRLSKILSRHPCCIHSCAQQQRRGCLHALFPHPVSSFSFLSPQRYVDVREYFESLVAERASGKGNWSTLTQTRDGKLRVYLRWPDADTTGTCRPSDPSVCLLQSPV